MLVQKALEQVLHDDLGDKRIEIKAWQNHQLETQYLYQSCFM